MNAQEIGRLLRKKSSLLNDSVCNNIRRLKKKAIENSDEQIADQLWCYEEIFKIQKLYLQAYNNLKSAALASDSLINEYDSEKSEKYELAWNELDQAEIEISFLEKNFCITESTLSDFYIDFILADIKKFQSLFPYKFFTSREDIIKEQRCSICGQVVSVRHPCEHIPGRVYMGKLCIREITDLEFLNVNIVTHPFDKFAILKTKGKTFDFKILDYTVPYLKPYRNWNYKIERRLRSQYLKVGRNDRCPCGSGMKFKYCIRKNPDLHFENHYIFIL